MRSTSARNVSTPPFYQNARRALLRASRPVVAEDQHDRPAHLRGLLRAETKTSSGEAMR